MSPEPARREILPNVTTYHGNVRVGGPADVRELTSLVISKVAVGPYDNNAYLLRCRETGDQLLVDAANEAATLLQLVGDEGLTRIVTTHRHADHWQALGKVAAATGARTAAHPLDTEAIPERTDELLGDGGTVAVGATTLRVIHLVGHTPGSIALLFDDPKGRPHLFAGDSLFPGGPGRTTNPTDFKSLMDDLEEKVFGQLPDETWVYPGHGKDTTLGVERPAIPAWRARGW
jgi:glyoxylase-like metal-dependent hydrolase (beta-lactamase superfamily II)